MGYPIQEDFEESVWELTVHFNRQPATGFCRLQLNEANSSNQCILGRSGFHVFFSHERTPSTSARQITSTGRIVKVEVSVHCLKFQNNAQILLHFLDLVQHRSLLSLYLLTYLLHGAESFLRSSPVNFAASQEIPRIYGTRKSLTVPTSAPHLSLS
jgi:hypothetical protein